MTFWPTRAYFSVTTPAKGARITAYSRIALAFSQLATATAYCARAVSRSALLMMLLAERALARSSWALASSMFSFVCLTSASNSPMWSVASGWPFVTTLPRSTWIVSMTPVIWQETVTSWSTIRLEE